MGSYEQEAEILRPVLRNPFLVSKIIPFSFKEPCVKTWCNYVIHFVTQTLDFALRYSVSYLRAALTCNVKSVVFVGFNRLKRMLDFKRGLRIKKTVLLFLSRVNQRKNMKIFPRE